MICVCMYVCRVRGMYVRTYIQTDRQTDMRGASLKWKRSYNREIEGMTHLIYGVDNSTSAIPSMIHGDSFADMDKTSLSCAESKTSLSLSLSFFLFFFSPPSSLKHQTSYLQTFDFQFPPQNSLLPNSLISFFLFSSSIILYSLTSIFFSFFLSFFWGGRGGGL